MEPGPQRVPHPERAGLAHQHEERGLEGVAHLVVIAQDGPARAQDDPAMPVDQGRERQLRGLAIAECEPLQQLPIGQARERAGLEERAERIVDRSLTPSCHEAGPDRF